MQNDQPNAGLPAGIVRNPLTMTKAVQGGTWTAADIGATDVNAELFRFDCPIGMKVQVLPSNYIYASLKTAAGVKITGGMSRLVKENITGKQTTVLWEASNEIFGDLGDINKRPRIGIPVDLNPSERLRWVIDTPGAIVDHTLSDIFVECLQYTQSL